MAHCFLSFVMCSVIQCLQFSNLSQYTLTVTKKICLCQRMALCWACLLTPMFFSLCGFVAALYSSLPSLPFGSIMIVNIRDTSRACGGSGLTRFCRVTFNLQLEDPRVGNEYRLQEARERGSPDARAHHDEDRVTTQVAIMDPLCLSASCT